MARNHYFFKVLIILLFFNLTKVLKNISDQCPLDFPIYDIVGTGGDKKNTYNISNNVGNNIPKKIF